MNEEYQNHVEDLFKFFQTVSKNFDCSVEVAAERDRMIQLAESADQAHISMLTAIVERTDSFAHMAGMGLLILASVVVVSGLVALGFSVRRKDIPINMERIHPTFNGKET